MEGEGVPSQECCRSMVPLVFPQGQASHRRGIIIFMVEDFPEEGVRSEEEEGAAE